MPGIRVYTGNRLETLADRLAKLVREPLASPYAPEVVVVQSAGMARWLSMYLARCLGVWANCEYPFPNAFLRDLFSRLLPDLTQTSAFDPAVLTFRIMGTLHECVTMPTYAMLRRYLGDDDSGLRCYQLARKIADTFDQYLVFRPDMIFRWEAGEEADDSDGAWQADLWRRLVDRSGNLHRARLVQRLVRAVNSHRSTASGLPERISIFGISYLPQFHLEVLDALSRLVPIHFFLMSPCREYWGDVLSAKEIREIRSAWGNAPSPDVDEDLLLESGHPLLGSMGGMGRDFFRLICGLEGEMTEFFEAPGRETLLGAVQSDILELRDFSAWKGGGPGRRSHPHPEQAVFSTQGTLQFHSCHSPMREVEVLYDQLLAMFAADPDLSPEDISVMTPDIEAYAPFIQAVFGAQPEGGPRIPFSVADRSVRRQSRVAEAFLSILDFKESRFGAGQIMALLETPPIQARFELNDGETEKALRWVRETRIRWGRDGFDRKELGLPHYGDNSWKAGIDRLLLGYAMPGEGKAMFGGVLPYDHVEGQDWKPLGKFLDFLDQLFETARGLRVDRSLSDWSAFLNDILERFFVSDTSTEPAQRAIRNALDELSACREGAQYDRRIALEPIKAFLCERLEAQPAGQGFLSGGVTFCALLPMRSIPFKVICLIGMNDGSFPRDSSAIGFDLIARHPRAGDRSRRADDKYLFLEAIVSARQGLYISYVGRNVQDNSRIPPSVLVDELLDYLREAYGLGVRDLVVDHRLQAFCPAYFSGNERLFSYSQENLEAAAGLSAPPVPVRAAFISEGLDPPGDDQRRVELDTLQRFFRNPSRFLLRNCLGMDLESGPLVPEEREAFTLDSLERFRLSSEMVDGDLAGEDLRSFMAVQRAAGRLPPGVTGEALFDRLRANAAALVDRARDVVLGERLKALPVEIEVAGFSLSGQLEKITPAGPIHVHPGKTSAARQLMAWISHLVYSVLTRPADQAQGVSYLICSDKSLAFTPLRNSSRILAALLKLYWEGLTRPLRFFPESSLAYAEQTLLRGRPREAALKSARAKWGPNEYAMALSECEDPYYDLCFGVSRGAPEPLGDDFMRLAEEIYGEMLIHRRLL